MFVEREIKKKYDVLHAENVEECDKKIDNDIHKEEIAEDRSEYDDNGHGELVNNVNNEYGVGHGQRADIVDSGFENVDVAGDNDDVVNNGSNVDGNSGKVFCEQDGTVKESDQVHSKNYSGSPFL